jgi:methylamine dehydrogenase light chain
MLLNLDKLGEKVTRAVAGHTSRRSFLSRLGVALVAAPVLPLLPVQRGAAQPPAAPVPPSDFARTAQTKDDTQCNYWRYCAIDGALCSCCGGGVHTCPAGSTPSPTSWVGTCLNPADGKSYVIAYRDCCGVGGCGQCRCRSTDRETPVYRPQGNNDIIWCFGAGSFAYHCSTAALVAVAE